VSNICRAVLRILKRSGFVVDNRYDELCRSGMGYVMSMLGDTQMPGPLTEEEFMICETYVCETLEISLGDLRAVCALYDHAETYKDFPSGYIKADNMFLSSPYEALLRDCYIPGPPQSKLVDHLPAESLLDTAAQNLPRNDEKEKEQPTSKSSESTVDGGEGGPKEAKATKKKRSRPKSRTQCGGESVSEIDSCSS